jgi:hypothetical protein
MDFVPWSLESNSPKKSKQLDSENEGPMVGHLTLVTAAEKTPETS